MPIIILYHKGGKKLFEGDVPTHVMAIEAAINQHICLDGVNLRGADLSHINLDSCSFRGANFQECNLTGANMSESRFIDCDFSGANFTEACLCYSDFFKCNFRYILAEKCDISMSSLKFCDFEGIKSLTFFNQRAFSLDMLTFWYNGKAYKFNTPPIIQYHAKGTRIIFDNIENKRVFTHTLGEAPYPIGMVNTG